MSGQGGRQSAAIGVSAVLLAVAPVAVAAATLGSSRTLVSWNGLAHVAIAERIASGGLPPENPFFAGVPLQSAWAHPALAAALAGILSVDSLHALALITLASLALLMAGALCLGARHFGSAGAGLLIGWLALAGLNPAGPAIALGKAVREGIPLLEPVAEPVETVFVGDESADLFMAHPLLGALQLNGDWRYGQNLPWFLDNSSQGPALALLLPLLALALARPSGGARAASLALGTLAAALSPWTGLAGAGALFCGSLAVSAVALVARPLARAPGAIPASAASGARAPGAALDVAACALLGALLASYAQLPGGGSGLSSLGLDAASPSKARALVAGFCVLAPLAAYGARRASAGLRPRLAAIALGGLALVAAVPFLELPGGGEHQLANVAGVLLAVPALGFASGGRLPPLAAAALLALFLPVTLCTLASFAARPPLPIASEGGVLVRVPDGDPLAQLYAWIRRETAHDAVFVVDAGHPVKMAAEVSELPAFTGRALFVDQPSPLTASQGAFAARVRLAARLTSGARLNARGAAALRALARPVYLLSHAGDDEHLAEQLTRHYGPPRFASGFVAVYALQGAP